MVLLIGPPALPRVGAVIATIKSNTCQDEIMPVTTTNKMAGFKRGSVILEKRTHPEAPSTAAAS